MLIGSAIGSELLSLPSRWTMDPPRPNPSAGINQTPLPLSATG